MVRNILSILCLFLPASALAQSTVVPNSKMEAAVAPFWIPKNSKSIMTTLDAADAQILENHKRTTSNTNLDRLIVARKSIGSILENVSLTDHGYSRVSCGDGICEIVLVFQNVPGDSPRAKYIVSSFYDQIGKESNIYQLTTPSMIIEGSDTSKGFSMLFYANVK
jgi:hypothetical protein